MSFRIEKKLFIKKENFFEFKKKLVSIGAKKFTNLELLIVYILII